MHVSIPFPKCMKTIMCANHLFMSMGAKENKSICKVVLKIKGGQFSYLPSASLQPTAITDFLLKNQNALQKRLNKYSKEKTT